MVNMYIKGMRMVILLNKLINGKQYLIKIKHGKQIGYSIQYYFDKVPARDSGFYKHKWSDKAVNVLGWHELPDYKWFRDYQSMSAPLPGYRYLCWRPDALDVSIGHCCLRTADRHGYFANDDIVAYKILGFFNCFNEETRY